MSSQLHASSSAQIDGRLVGLTPNIFFRPALMSLNGLHGCSQQR
jgi:hypothetical protein